MKHVLLIMFILGGLIFGALNYHVILLDNSLKILKKPQMTLDSTFVDARGTKKFKLLLDPALMRAGFNDLLKSEGITITTPEAESEPVQE